MESKFLKTSSSSVFRGKRWKKRKEKAQQELFFS